MSNRLMDGPGAPRRDVSGEIEAGLDTEELLKVSCEQLRLQRVGKPASKADAIASLAKMSSNRIDGVMRR